MKLYVGCSLTQAPEAFRQEVVELKKELAKQYEIMDFLGLTKGTAQEVYRWDIHECVAKCDAFIALCDFPSIGLGYELSVAVEKLKKPTLALAHKDAQITRLLLGVDAPHFTFMRYISVQNIPKLVAEFTKK